MSKYERLARMLRIITLVRANPRLTRSDLARLCEVDSVRTIQRDINSIAIAQVPIYWSGKGYEIMPNFFLPPLALSREEALSLALCAKVYGSNEGDFHEGDIKSAISKIMVALPKATRESIELDLRKIDVQSKGTTVTEGLVRQLYQAILDAKTLRVNYHTYSDMVSERTIDPYALTLRGHVWYLVALCHARNAILMFNTNRIKTLDYTGRTFQYPSDFSVTEYMKNSWQSDEFVVVTVKFSARVAPLIKGVRWYPNQRIEGLSDGSVLYIATVAGTEEIRSWILGYGDDAEVISPQSLRDEIAATLERARRIYGEPQLQTCEDREYASTATVARSTDFVI